MESQEEIIQGCLKGDRQKQYAFYQQFSPVLYGVCLRYLRDDESAADMLQECFLKIFEKLGDYRGEGSLEGWLRKLTINMILNTIKQNQRLPLYDDLSDDADRYSHVALQPDHLTQEELVKIIQRLPTGYKTVFNLYEIEGYSHQEIAEMLGISENTSRTQLRNAKIKLQNILYQMYGKNTFE
ncbi:MAG: sigma-70 family RNA polymerase sigma factor [Bacteroidales bacterium]|nr:sigma-70 family RNA polymerase sigma factor [Bacteroidales bacterium]